jgi:hypothetical protein
MIRRGAWVVILLVVVIGGFSIWRASDRVPPDKVIGKDPVAAHDCGVADPTNPGKKCKALTITHYYIQTDPVTGRSKAQPSQFTCPVPDDVYERTAVGDKFVCPSSITPPSR